VNINKVFFQEQQARLAEQFDKLRLKATSDTERGEIIKDFVLQLERMRHNCFKPGAERDEIDRLTLEKLADPLELSPEFCRDEAILRRLTIDPSAASRYWDQSHKQLSKAQSERASKPRPKNKDKITEEIEGILSVNPKLSAKKVGQALEIYDEITIIEEEYHHREDASRLKVRNLRGRVSDAKKRLKKDSA
jgi:hypothetical protein